MLKLNYLKIFIYCWDFKIILKGRRKKLLFIGVSGVLFFLFLPNNMLGGKKIEKGMKKKEENAYFSPNW